MALNRITVNAFYFQLYDRKPSPYFGYLKATVGTLQHNGSKDQICIPHNHYPRIFFPLMITGKERILADHLAMRVDNVTPPMYAPNKREWQVSYLRPAPRQSDRERLDVIIAKLKTRLESILAKAKKLPPADISHRSRTFLAQFLPPLREGLEEKVMYGTLTERIIEFTILERDLPSYQREHYRSAKKPSRESSRGLVNQPPRGDYY